MTKIGAKIYLLISVFIFIFLTLTLYNERYKTGIGQTDCKIGGEGGSGLLDGAGMEVSEIKIKIGIYVNILHYKVLMSEEWRG